MSAHLPDFVVKILRDRFRWVALAMAMIVIGVGYGLFLNARIQAIQSVSFSDLERAKTQLASAEARRESFRTTKRTFEQTFTPSDLDRLNRILPTQSDFPELLLFVQAVVESADLQLDSISVTDVIFTAAAGAAAPSADSGAAATSSIQNLEAKDIAISVSKSTGYDQFKKFLTKLESSERLIDALTISFQNPTGDSSNSLSFTLRVYLLPDPSPVT